ncbi:putative flavin reductase like domain-containing protein [Rosellinia necatrix]|uniref:Putative flavin reductase like domain-containing protein n=1 Tax=Rosellinia necatrix TaxID=77044 RepID=A0A1W2TVK9_ROSNE|nr:putative flavin reductase like domain-containing protein [Rosellinia necatrix]
MQSVRGLWRAIPPRSPRITLCNRPPRSFISSSTRHRTRQSPQTLDAEEPIVHPKWSNAQIARQVGGRQAYISEGKTKDIADAADDSTTTRHMFEGSHILEQTADPNNEARDGERDRARDGARDGARDEAQYLCSSVTAAMAKLPHPVVVITTLDRTYHAQVAAGVPVEEMRHPIARGITVSSLTSLCIRPRPHVMFNMTLPSTMYEALVACQDFNVHILAPDEAGAHVASVFTRGNRVPFPRVGESEGPRDGFDDDADLGVFVGLKNEGFRHASIVNRDAWHEQYQNAKRNCLRVAAVPYEEGPINQDVKETNTTRQFHHVPLLHSRAIIEVLHCRLARTIHPDLANTGQNVIMIGEVVDITFPDESVKNSVQAPVALGYADRKYRSIGGAIHLHERDGFKNGS